MEHFYINRGLYIHIPFCKTKCFYCDFVRTTDSTFISEYVDALILQIEYEASKNRFFTTIYLGGGTPSFIGIDELKRVFSALQKNTNMRDIEEFTVECNPEDISVELIKLFRQYGVNRVSLGVQSMNDDMLRFMNRRHSAAKVANAIHLLKENCIENISVDIIYGLPKLETYSFISDLEEFLKLNVSHISAYSLSYEEGSVFTLMLRKNKLSPLPEEEVVQQYNYIINRLNRAGYEHYEISNFAHSAKYSKHNSFYWKGVEYVGIGAAASGFDGRKRYTTTSDIKEYIVSTKRGETIRKEEILTSTDHYNELIMLGLRTKFGVSETSIIECGKRFYDYFIKNVKSFIDDKSVYLIDGRYYIKEEKWFISDYILSSLFF